MSGRIQYILKMEFGNVKRNFNCDREKDIFIYVILWIFLILAPLGEERVVRNLRILIDFVVTEEMADLV